MATALKIARSRSPDDDLAIAIAGLDEAKRDLAQAEEAKELAQQAVITLLQRREQKSATVYMPDGRRLKATYVQGERLDVDEAGLRKALTAPVYDKLCDLKLNRNKLELAIAEQRIDAITVASYTTKVPYSPHIRLSQVEGSHG